MTSKTTEPRLHPSWLTCGSDIAIAIMRGEHDAEIAMIAQACKQRTKSQYRKGMRVRLTGTRSVDLEGKEAVILKVNQKTISVGVGAATTDQWGTTYEHGEYNVSPSLIEVI